MEFSSRKSRDFHYLLPTRHPTPACRQTGKSCGSGEAEKNGGFELGALSLQSLEKIEELYLLLIEMEKRLKTLEEENAVLKTIIGK